MTTPSLSVFDQSVSEKLRLAEDLWDDIASNPEGAPVHDWQREGKSWFDENKAFPRILAQLCPEARFSDEVGPRLVDAIRSGTFSVPLR
jgi:hypothetical protein